MPEIHASQGFKAPPDRVFALLSDHVAFLSGGGLRCRLLREGHDARDGVGAVREVRAGGLIFIEDIIAFEPPHHLAYVIRQLTWRGGRALPIRHERGWIDVVPDGAGTQVDWRSRFKVDVPVLGPLFAPAIASRIRGGFARLLARAARQAATPGA